MSQYFLKPYKPFEEDINVKVDLSNYATKSDLKNATGIDPYKLALKWNLENLKADVDKLGIDKLVPVPVDLSKLSDEVRNDVAKKTVYDNLAPKVNSIDTRIFLKKLSMTQINQNLKRKFLILVDSSEKQIKMLKLLI